MTLYLGNNLISGVATPTEPTRNLGQIIESLVPLTDAGLHLLDGALINGSGIYSAFVTYIAGLASSYPDLFETEANWQQSVTDYGVCGKFVYDSVANTVRLPKITGILEGTTDVTALGDLVEAGLPNITGNIAGFCGLQLGSQNTNDYIRGSFTKSSDNSQMNAGGGDGGKGLAMDASLSSPIYGNSSTVQPQTIKCYYYIVIATTTKTDIEVDIDEIATDLNGKADVDLSNINASQSAKNEIVSWGMPDYSGQIQLPTGTTEQTYTTPSKGFIGYNFLMSGNNTGYVKVNDITVITDRPAGSNYYDFVSGIIPVDRNDVVKYWTNSSAYNYNNFQFYPMKGAN